MMRTIFSKYVQFITMLILSKIAKVKEMAAPKTITAA